MPTSSTDLLTNTFDENAPCVLHPSSLYSLPNKAILIVDGEDAEKFLQGQVSCDVNKIDVSHSLVGSHSTPKGRMISSFRLLQTDSRQYALVIPENNAKIALAAFKKYIVFSKADITLSEQVVIGCHGPKAEKSLQEHDKLLPKQTNDTVHTNDTTILCIDQSLPAYEIYTNKATAEKIYKELSINITPSSQAEQQLIEHKNALGFIENRTTDLFIAQMLNYQAIDAISFEKGCYTGQEIIARMKYLGKLKKHMSHVIITSTHNIEAGLPVSLEQDGQNVGNIVSAVKTGDNLWDVLWVLNQKAQTAEILFCNNHSLSIVSKQQLPYIPN